MTRHNARHQERTRRRGMALLEVIVATTVFTTACVAAVMLVSDSIAAVQRAREADTAMRRASALFDAVSLWTRDDLDRRLGERAQGPWRMRVDRPLPTLYVVTLTDSTTRVELLHTALYRSEAIRAPR